jgi:hypothetical protein
MDGRGFAMTTESKTCSKCGKSKPLDAFETDKRLKSGKRAACRLCRRKQRIGHYYRNAERMRLASREYRLEHLTVRKKSCKQWRDENREHCLEYYQKKNKEYNSVLPDFIIKSRLVVGRGFKPEQITPDLIAATRMLIKLKRAVKGIEA